MGDKVNDRAVNFKKSTVVDDPIKKLLHNIIDCFDSKTIEEQPKIKPTVVEPKYEVKESYNPPVKDVYSEPVSSSGFDFNEALHPTMELDEILKSFNLGKKEGEGKNGK